MRKDESLLPKTISLFSGAMGLDLGLEEAGIGVAACVEMDGPSCRTIRANRSDVPVVEGDIRRVEPQRILDLAGLERGEAFLVSGGPPCQAFSTAGRRGSFGDPRGSLFADFVRFVGYMRPEYFLMENVRGLLSAAIEHRPLAERGDGHAPLKPEERLGSALEVILGEFDKLGYTVGYRLLNAADYGVPQNRQRIVFIGSREGREVAFPKPTHSRGGVGGLPPWRTLGDALSGLADESPEYPKYSEEKAGIFETVPEGGGTGGRSPSLCKKKRWAERTLRAEGAWVFTGGSPSIKPRPPSSRASRRRRAACATPRRPAPSASRNAAASKNSPTATRCAGAWPKNTRRSATPSRSASPAPSARPYSGTRGASLAKATFEAKSPGGRGSSNSTSSELRS